jgi:hypothetical protein
MTTPGGAVRCKGPRSRRQLRGIPENFSLCASHRFSRVGRASPIVSGAAFAEVATWQTQQWSPGRCTSRGRDVSYRASRALLFSCYLHYHARLVSLAAPFLFPRIRRGLRFAPVGHGGPDPGSVLVHAQAAHNTPRCDFRSPAVLARSGRVYVLPERVLTARFYQLVVVAEVAHERQVTVFQVEREPRGGRVSRAEGTSTVLDLLWRPTTRSLRPSNSTVPTPPAALSSAACMASS